MQSIGIIVSELASINSIVSELASICLHSMYRLYPQPKNKEVKIFVYLKHLRSHIIPLIRTSL